MLNPRSLLLAIAACAWLATSAAAQETGSISGAVFDSNGGLVAGAVITVSGPQLPRGRTFTTNESGMLIPVISPDGQTLWFIREGQDTELGNKVNTKLEADLKRAITQYKQIAGSGQAVQARPVAAKTT